MKRFLITILFLLTVFFSFAANWEWVTSSGGSGMDRVWDIALDNLGNVLVTGEFVDTLQIGSMTVQGWGLNDIFAAKFDANGNPLWAKAFGGNDGDIGLSIDTDALGNCYITGYYGGTAHFEEQDLVTTGSWDIFVLKLDSDGNKVWVYSEGGASNDIGYGLSVMPDGRCFVTGWFGDTINFHDGSSLTSYGGSDILTFAYAANGDLLWKHKAGAVGVEYGYKIAVDALANSYVTGVAGQDCNFDGTYAPGDGAFVASYNSDGLIRWINSAPGAGVNSIAVDRSPSLIEQFGCITGRLTGNATFGIFNLSSVEGSDDAYGAVFELLTGNWTAAESGGGAGSDKGRACTYNGHPYYVGSYEATAGLFDFNVTAAGMADGYVYSAGGAGNQWLLSEGGLNNDTPTDIAVDNNGNVFICGWYSGIARFGTNLMITSGNDSDLDMFIAKINTATPNEDDLAVTTLSRTKCYPNPFVHTLKIEYHTSVITKQPAMITIYNVKGAVVQKIPARKTKDASFTAEWNGYNSKGEKCPAGIYFINTSGKNHHVKKVILLN